MLNTSFRTVALALLLGTGLAPSSPAQSYTFTTLAGSPGGIGFEDGSGSAARFGFPIGVAVDGSGNLYVADFNSHTIRKVSASGAVTTLAGLAGTSGITDGSGNAARFNQPGGVAVDGAGNVYVADFNNHTIRKVTSGGVVTTIAGLAGSSGSSDGSGSAARFNRPRGVAVDGAGNVYVADRDNQTIRKVTSGGLVTTLAGLAGTSGSSDGTGSAARFLSPAGVAVDSVGNVYVADSDNFTIRKVTSGGVVTTLAGLAGNRGSSDGTGSAARFDFLFGVAVDGAGNVYVPDFINQTIRKVTSGGVVSTLAGLAGARGSSDGTGSAARFFSPAGAAVDGSGNVYIAEFDNHTIRKVTSGGVVTTLAGLAASSGSSDGTGSAARFNLLRGVAVDGAGNVYIADSSNHTIRKVTSGGAVTTLAGLAGSSGTSDGIGGAARFSNPTGVAVDGAGNVYVADSANHTIRRVSGSGIVTTLAGLGGSPGSSDGSGSTARFSTPHGVAVDGAGNVYVADQLNHTIRKVTSGGVVTTLAGLGGSSGSSDGSGNAARFNSPLGVAVDGAGSVYVADFRNDTIRKVTTGGVVTTLAGLAGSFGANDGSGSAARFVGPSAIAVDLAGNLYVTDMLNHTIRRVTSAGVVTTLAGRPGSPGSVNGSGSAARFNEPRGVAVDAAGNIYVGDTNNHTIRIGALSLADVATIDAVNGAVGVTRQLITSPSTATSWEWSVIRQPSGSVAQLSSSSVRNPTFTPDTTGFFVFRLLARDSTRASITTVELNAQLGPAPVLSAVSPANGGTPGGKEITISGTGFLPGATVTLGGTAATRVAFIDSLTLSVLTPPHAAGAVDVVVTNPDRQSVTAVGAFTYVAPSGAASITSVTPATGPTSGGTAITISGTSFSSDAVVTVGGALAREIRVTSATSISAVTPPHASGAVDVVVTNGDGQSITRTSSFTYACNAVATPSLTTPPNNATDAATSPVLTFSTTAGAFRYDVLLDTVDPPVRVVAQDLAADTSAATISFTPSNLLPGTKYFWRVVAKGDPACLPLSTSSSPVQSFTTIQPCSAPGAFTLTAPAADATGLTATVQLTWTASAGASSYDVFLGNGSSFSRLGSTSSTSFAATDLVPGTTYTWNVVAHATCNDTLTIGTARRSFTVTGACAAAGSFTLTTPAAAETNVSPTPELKWSASANASSYDVFLETANPPRLFRAGVTRTSISLAGLIPGRTYFWRVVANVACDLTRSSSTPVASFTIRGGCIAPGKPAITFVPPGNVAIGQTYVIAWSEVPDLDADGSYLVERSLSTSFSPILDSQLTGSSFASFTSVAEGTVHHRVRAIPSCGAAGASANSDTKGVAIVRGRPNVVFTVIPRAVVTNVGESISDKKTRFAIENITNAPVQLIVATLPINSNPFFTVTDPSDPDAFLITLQPRRPKSFEIRFNGPSNTQAGSYQGVVVVSAPGSDLVPYAFVNLKVGGQGAARPEFRIGTTPTEFLALPAFSGDDANRPAVEVDVFNPGSTPMELAAEIGPDVWLVPESGWNASPVPANSSVKVRLLTRRERAPAGSALPRYTYFTVRTRTGESARLLVQDRETSTTANGRGSSLDPGIRSYIVPRVVSMTTGTGRPTSSRLRLSNVGGEAVQAELFFTPAGMGGFDATAVKRASILLPPNDVVSFTDPLVQLFGLTPPVSGSLEVRADAGKIGSIEVVSSFASNATGRGQRDGKMPAVIRGEGARVGAAQVVGGIRTGTGVTAGLALVETTGLDRASVRVALFDKDGVRRGEQVVELLSYELEEIANLLTTLGGGATSLDAGRLVLTVESGAGAVVGVVTLTDSTTDGTATLIAQPVPAVSPAKRASVNLHGMSMSPLSWVAPNALTEQRIVPLAVHGSLSNSLTHVYRTSLSLTAPLDGVAGFTLRYVDGENALSIDRTVNLAAGKAIEYADVIEELFGVGAMVQSQGQILVSTDRGQVYATLSSAVVGTTAFTLIGSVPIVTPQSEALTGGSGTMQRPLLIDGVEQSVDPTRGSRWAMLLGEIAGQPATVTVRLYEAGNRSASIAEKSFTVAALSQTKLETIFAAMDLDTDLRQKDRTNVLAVVTATGGTGMVAATAVVVDNVTGDAEAILLAPRGGVPATGVARVSTVRTVEVAAPLFRRADVNGDGTIAVADIFYMINALFTNGPAPIGSGDANSDGGFSVADIFYLISFLFTNGPAPAP